MTVSHFLRIERTNTNENPKDTVSAVFEYYFRSAIVDNMANWLLAVHRITLPTKAIPRMSSTNPDLYGVHVKMNGSVQPSSSPYVWSPGHVPEGYKHTSLCTHANNESAWLFNNHTVSPDGKSVTHSNPVALMPSENTSKRAVVENINRSAARAYLGALWGLEYSQHESMDHSANEQVSTAQISDGSSGMYPYTRDITAQEMSNGVELGSFDLKPSQSTYESVPDWGKVAGVVLRIDRLRIAVEVAGQPVDTPYSIVLESPDGQRAVVATMSTRVPINASVWFSDGATTKSGEWDQSAHARPMHVLPLATFQSFFDQAWASTAAGSDYANVNCTWKLVMVVDNFTARHLAMQSAYASVADPTITVESDGDIAATIHVFPSYSSFPTLVPVMHIDDNDGSLKVVAQREWLDKPTCSMNYSESIASLVGLETGSSNGVFSKSLLDGKTVFTLNPPGEIIASNVNPINNVISVPSASEVKPTFTNLKLVELAISNVPVDYEVQASSLAGDQTLQTFVIQSDSLDNQMLIYDYDGPLISSRNFTFTRSGPLEHMVIVVYLHYTDGTRQLLPIAGGHWAEILLQFRRTF